MSGQIEIERARKDGLYLMGLGLLVFLLLGTVLTVANPMMADFKGYYYSARCLLRNLDPYNPAEASSVFRQEDNVAEETEANKQIVARNVYLPTIFTFTVPMALLPFNTAWLLFTLVRTASFLVGALLVWDIGAKWAPQVNGALIGLVLASSELVMVIGNVFPIAVGLCLIAVWCFLKKRFPVIGVFCLASSLVLKPQDGFMIWAYLFLAGGIYRKRALQTLAIAVLLSIPAVLWVTHVGPEWPSEIRSNLAIFSGHGNMNDEGPTAAMFNKPSFIIDLQTVVSYFRDDPRIYNPISFLIIGISALFWSIETVLWPPSYRRALLAIASASALTMLPVYHRTGDAKLLLLAIPATAMLLAEDRRIGKVAFVLTLAALIANSDLTWVAAIAVLNHYPGPNADFAGQLRTIAQIFPAPLSILAVGVFNLWVYMRSGPEYEPCLASK